MNDTENIKVETVVCTLCAENASQLRLTGRDFKLKTPGEWSIVECSHCGLARTNPRPAPEEVDSIYPKHYSPYRPKRPPKKNGRWRLQHWVMRSHWGYPEKTSFVEKLLSFPLLAWVKYQFRNYNLFPWEGTGRLLDYGCGTGGYLQKMAALGWNVRGIDFSEQAVACCSQAGMEASVGDSASEAYPSDSFDVVTLFHVLEHVPSPTKTLQDVRNVLTQNGKLVIAVPHIDSMGLRWFGKYWFPLELPRHFTHFSKKTLKSLLEKNGFEVEKISPQLYGQTFAASYQLLSEAKDSAFYKCLSKCKRWCFVLELLSALCGKPNRIVVYARKK